MRMVGQIGQGLVFAAQALVHAAAVLGHQLDDPHHIAQRIEHLVSDTEAAAAQLLLNAEAIRQDEILRQVHQVIGELPHNHSRAAQIRGGFILGLGQNQVIQALAGDGRAGVPFLGVELAELLQPLVDPLGQVRLVFRGLHREAAVCLHHLVDAFKGQLTGQQFIDDQPNGVEVGGNAGLGRVLEALRSLVGGFQVIHHLIGDGGGAVLAHPGKIETRHPGLPALGHQNGVRGEIAVDHLMPVRMVQGGEHVAHHLEFLVKSQRQGGLVDVQAQGLAGQVLCDQHHLIFIVGDEQILHRQHVGVGRHVRHSAIGVADLLELFLAGGLVLVRVGLIDPQAGHAAALAQQVVLGAVFGVAVGAAQLLIHLPVAEHQRRAFGLGVTGDRLGDLRVEAGDGIQPVVGDAARVAEVFQAVLEVGHVRAVDACLVEHGGVIGGEQHSGMHIGLAQFDQAGVALADNGSHGLGMAAQLGQRREKRLPPLGIPLGAIHIDVAPRPFDIHQIHRVRREDSDVDFEHLLTLAHLEVVEDQPAIGKMIPEETDGLAFRFVCGLPDGYDLRH